MVSKSLRDWDSSHSHAEFAYNMTLSYATSYSPFEVCYGLNPFTFLKLLRIPQESKTRFKAKERTKYMKKSHQ